MNPRSLVATLHDLFAAAIAWLLAYWFRFNLDAPYQYAQMMWSYLVWVVPVQGVAFYGFGLYRGIWRFASIPDLRRIVLAVGVSALAVPMVLFMVNRLVDVPRSVLVLDPILLVLIMGGSRFFYRAWKDGALVSPGQLNAAPVIIMGAGTAAAALLRDLVRNPNWRAVALLDDDPRKLGSNILNVPIVGGFADIAAQAKRFGTEHAIVAMSSVSAGVRRRATEMAVDAGLKVMILPPPSDLLDGKVSVSQMRRVELEDLLGRDPVQLDDAGLSSLFVGQVVLVSGAGGSIGSELCRQIGRYAPSRVVFLELSEFALYRIEQEFSTIFPKIAGAYIVSDVKDAALLESVFAEYKPAIVFHAAAYKHVPLMENFNAWQAVRNNVQGTLCLARAAVRHGVREFVLISTDKAVNPTNVMGATKRLAERVCQVIQSISPSTRFVMVRFGNVLGSSGSVIPKFREQIAAGGPVTVTHREITRYFMLIPEACQLVLQAALQASQGEEGGRIVVLDMGEPVRIYDLARDMIRLSGYTESEIRIEVTGLRPGEKLYEELLADSEHTLATPHPKLRVAKPDHSANESWLQEIDAWLAMPFYGEAETKQRLKHYVPEYSPAV
ncbi:nucleoside-diphosphate sugar epimerase/dehydratase [Bordetella sp. FB-8]|uniref:polysaccharide biosynthesis protein n=1 Tax=Bordetella sp. FB-8 TaxID=1159870 RepID=UPI00035D47F8|nr:nucleoside-diphosphate sugar epimerase/dehydratase [Bordetella sp. FB-8]